LTKDAALATEALVFRGQEAVAAGLVDGIVHPAEAFDAFVSAIRRRG
jgi:enoyl-CoA hydratase/carnithine racemase